MHAPTTIKKKRKEKKRKEKKRKEKNRKEKKRKEQLQQKSRNVRAYVVFTFKAVSFSFHLFLWKSILKQERQSFSIKCCS
jgi:hypothetical protein